MNAKLKKIMNEVAPDKEFNELTQEERDKIYKLFEETPSTPEEKEREARNNEEKRLFLIKHFGKENYDQLTPEECKKHLELSMQETRDVIARIREEAKERKRQEENREAISKGDEFAVKRAKMLRQAGHDSEAQEIEEEIDGGEKHHVYVSVLSQQLAVEHSNRECPIPPGLNESEMNVSPECIRNAKLHLKEHGIVACDKESFANLLANPMIDGDCHNLSELLDTSTKNLWVEGEIDARLNSYHNTFVRYLFSWQMIIMMWLVTWICTALYCAGTTNSDGTPNSTDKYIVSFLWFMVPTFLFNTLCLTLIRFTQGLLILSKKRRFGYKIKQAKMSQTKFDAVNTNLSLCNLINKTIHGPLFFVFYIIGFFVFKMWLRSFALSSDIMYHSEPNWAQLVVLGWFGGIFITSVAVGLATIMLDSYTGRVISCLMNDKKLRLKIWHLNSPESYGVYTPNGAVYSWMDAGVLINRMGLAKIQLEIMNRIVDNMEINENARNKSFYDAKNNVGIKLTKIDEPWYA
jgi:hypothetical protein